MKYKTIFFCEGEAELSSERNDWIKDFLLLFEPIISEYSNLQIKSGVLSPDVLDVLNNDVLVIAHELRNETITDLNLRKLHWIDIRVSPVRFVENDFMYAICSNVGEISERIRNFSVPSYKLKIEARALSSSFRWRDLGQKEINTNSVVFFFEQNANRDSINYKKVNELSVFDRHFRESIKGCDNLYYVSRGKNNIDDINYLENLGFNKLTANIYSILSSDKVSKIIAIRGGVLSEAKYFNKESINLDAITTPLMDFETTDIAFHNVAVNTLLQKKTWDYILSEIDNLDKTVENSYSNNLLRRSLNIWNSTAEAMHFKTEEWNHLIHNPLFKLEFGIFKNYAEKTDAILPDALIGDWEWFNGDIVTINKNGIIKSDSDYGIVTNNRTHFVFDWKIKKIQDHMVVSSDMLELSGRNSYNDRVSAKRI